MTFAAPSPQGPSVRYFCVGRDDDLDRVLGAADRLEDHGGTFVAVTGRSGIGKSTFLLETERCLDDRRVQVFVARCRPGLKSLHPLIKLTQDILGRLYDNNGDPALVAQTEELLATLEGRPEGAPRPDRTAVFEALAQILQALASSHPIAVFIHDLDTADPATQEAIRYLSRVLTSQPELNEDPFRGLLVVSAEHLNDVGIDPRWDEGIQRLHIALEGIDREGVRAYLASEAVLERLLEKTEGIPHLLEAIIGGDLAKHAASPLARATPPERKVLEFLAAFGRPLSAEILTELTAQSPDQVATAINRLVGRHVLEKTVHRGTIHVAYRRAGDERAAYETLDFADRQTIHAAIGYHLQGDPQEIEACADHLLLGGCGDDAIEAAERAAEALEIAFCHERAADFYERALALSPRQEKTEQLLRALYALLENTAQFDRAIEVAEQLIEISPDDPEAELKLARLHLRRGNLKTARRHLENLGTRAAIRDQPILWARVLAERADADYLAGQSKTGRQAAEEGIALVASTDGAVTTQLGLQNTLGKIALDAGDLGEAQALFSANLDRADAMGLMAEAARARIHLGWIALNAGAYDEAQKHYEVGHDLASQAGEYRYVGGCLQHMGVVAERLRDYATAIHRYQQAVESWKKVGHRSYLAWVGLDLAKLYLDLGALGRAEAMVKLADKLADAEPPLATRVNLEILRGRLAKAGCRFDEAAEHFRRAEHLAQDAQQTDRARHAGLELAALDIDRNNRSRASRRVAKVLASAPHGSLRLRALLLSASLAVHDSLDVARKRWFDALDLAEKLHDHEAAWEAHYHLAMLARRDGRENEARRHLLDAAHLEAKVRAAVPEDLRGSLEEQPLRIALRAAIEAHSDVTSPRQAPPPSRPRLEDGQRDDGIIGSHPRIQQVLSQIEKVAATNATVLIRGESGTGKELVADAIHDRSDRANKPLVKVNCAALVENLLLSELFGHERGAFTGATQRKAGRFELADGGTIFLDEIGDISPKTQVALLRVLQERRFERVGGTTSLEVDVRIIFATNRDLRRMVDEGKFREDLYYRLRGVQIDLPPLRDRRSDLLALSNHFFARIAKERGTPQKELDDDALELLSKHPWPGNIRELENVLRSVSLFAEGSLLSVSDFADYPEFAELQAPQPPSDQTTSIYGDLRQQGMSLRDYKKHIEALCIQDALAESSGNITRAADLLGMKRPRLSQLIKEHNLASR